MVDDHPEGDGQGPLVPEASPSPDTIEDDSPLTNEGYLAYVEALWSDVAEMVDFTTEAADFLGAVRRFVRPTQGDPADFPALAPGFPLKLGAYKVRAKARSLCALIRRADWGRDWFDLSEDAQIEFHWFVNLFKELIWRWGFSHVWKPIRYDLDEWFSTKEPEIDPNCLWIDPEELNALARALEAVEKSLPDAVGTAYSYSGGEIPPRLARRGPYGWGGLARLIDEFIRPEIAEPPNVLSQKSAN